MLFVPGSLPGDLAQLLLSPCTALTRAQRSLLLKLLLQRPQPLLQPLPQYPHPLTDRRTLCQS